MVAAHRRLPYFFSPQIEPCLVTVMRISETDGYLCHIKHA